MKRIGIFGLSGNPPHVSHKSIIKTVLNEKHVDEIIILPVFKHNFEKKLLPFSFRLTMCMLAFNDIPQVTIKDYEFWNEFKGTYDKVNYIQTLYPDSELYIIIGGDCAFEMDRWYNWKELVKEYNFIIALRNGIKYISLPDWCKSNRHIILDKDIPDISSTKIRDMIVNGNEEVKNYLDKNVYDYIKTNNFYKD